MQNLAEFNLDASNHHSYCNAIQQSGQKHRENHKSWWEFTKILKGFCKILEDYAWFCKILPKFARICKILHTLRILALKWDRQNMSLENIYFAPWMRKKLGKKEFLKLYIVLLRVKLNCNIYASQMGQSASAR